MNVVWGFGPASHGPALQSLVGRAGLGPSWLGTEGSGEARQARYG